MNEKGTDARCRNCGSDLHAEFCAVCGQREGRGDLQLLDAAGDLFGEFATPDSKFWRTLWALLFKPGFLSAEFNAGRRASYLPPFRLYLVISFVMFLIIPLTAGDEVYVGKSGPNDADSELLIGDPNSIPEEWRFTVDLSSEEEDNEASDESPAPALDVAEAFGVSVDDDSPAWLKRMAERAQTNSRLVSENPSEYIQSVLEHLPQMMFVMLPVFAILLRIVYLFSPFHYLQHFVFALHLHSTAYIMYTLGALVEMLGLHIESVFSLVMVAYVPLSLRRCYASSWPGALAKSLLLSVSYGMVLLICFAIGAVLILATL